MKPHTDTYTQIHTRRAHIYIYILYRSLCKKKLSQKREQAGISGSMVVLYLTILVLNQKFQKPMKHPILKNYLFRRQHLILLVIMNIFLFMTYHYLSIKTQR
jgi:hypothetical protein